MSCEDGHCVTCADEAVPLRVDEVLDEATARCDGSTVLTELVGEVAAGDVVLVHAGVALARVEA